MLIDGRSFRSRTTVFGLALGITALIGACRPALTPTPEPTSSVGGPAATNTTGQGGGAGSSSPTDGATGVGSITATADAGGTAAAGGAGAPTSASQVATTAASAQPGATSASSNTPIPDDGSRYVVVGVTPDDTLNVRSAVGSDSVLLGTLSPFATGLRITEVGAAPDGGFWVRVTGGAADGWVNRGFLAHQSGTAEAGIAERANEIIHALMSKDYSTLSGYVHPTAGVRFSPYAFVHDDAVTFDAAEVAALGSDATVRNWGEYQGVGGPIQATYAAYAADFVLDAAFESAPYVGFDVVVGEGTTINNIGTAFPGASFVEYHYDGFDPANAGFDWLSLRLLLEQYAGEWMLIGIVHDEWTT